MLTSGHVPDWRFKSCLYAFLVLVVAAILYSIGESFPAVILIFSGMASLFAGMTVYYAGGRPLVVFYCLLLGTMVAANWKMYARSDLAVYQSAFAAFFCCLIACVPEWRSFRLFIALLALTLLVFIECGIGGYHSLANHPLGDAQIFAFSESTVWESFGYILTHWQLQMFLLLYLCVSAGCLVFVSRVHLPRLTVQNRIALCALVGILTCAILRTNTHLYDRLPLLGMVVSYCRKDVSYRSVAHARKLVVDTIGAVRRSDFKSAVYVVVVGESANRHHLGLYGYFRDTTPKLDRRKDQLVVFRDAISSHSTTLMSLRRALTLATVEGGREYSDQGMFSIIEILRGAGIKAYWFSNQSRWGFWGNLVSSVALGADESVMLEDGLGRQDAAISSDDSRKSEGFSLTDRYISYDADLLPQLDRVLTEMNGPAVIFLHITGSHAPYIFSYPKNFDKFPNDEDQEKFGPDIEAGRVNSYDNTIYYTDYILDEVIRRLESHQLPTSLLYFSDHGESVYLGKEHDPSDFGPGHVEVPLLLWFSSLYRDAYPETVAQARAHADSPFMLDSLSQLIMDWAHVDGPFYKPSRSPLNANFAPAPRLTIDGAVDYDSLKQNYCTVTRAKTGFSLGPC